MSNFAFNVKVMDPEVADVTDAALGTSGQGWKDSEVGKAVKLAAANNYVLCTDGDEIEGFVAAIEPNTVNAGYSFGAVQRRGRIQAVLAAGVTNAAVGMFVVAAAQEAVGTQVNGNKPLVKPGVAAAQSGTTPFAYTERTPNTHMWRIIRLVSGGDDAGGIVLIERV